MAFEKQGGRQGQAACNQQCAQGLFASGYGFTPGKCGVERRFGRHRLLAQGLQAVDDILHAQGGGGVLRALLLPALELQAQALAEAFFVQAKDPFGGLFVY